MYLPPMQSALTTKIINFIAKKNQFNQMKMFNSEKYDSS